MRTAHRKLADRRAARLVARRAPPLTLRASSVGPADSTNVDGLALLATLVTAHEPERLLGRGEARASDRALRAAARRLAADARGRDAVRAERLIVELRASWSALPSVRALDGPVRQSLWLRVVRLCCEEFYAPRAAARRAAAARAARTA